MNPTLERRPHTGHTPTDRSVAAAIKAEARRLGLGRTKPLARSHRARTAPTTADGTTVEVRDEVRRAESILFWGAR
jgi:hypothetical protein